MSNTEYETITSDQLIDINTNFKIIAGPGAGKTYWLVRHIKHVLEESKILKSASKIACITYTTVAAEEINNRLKANSDRVEISTIHSFLYNNVIKPYIYLLKDENEKCIVNYIKLDGHVENVPSNGKIIQWKKVNNLFHFKDDNKIKKCLMDLDWSLKDQELLLKVRKDYNRKVGRYYIKEECFPSYKQLFWDEGIIHHEDVLYFSFNLLEQYPMIKEFLSAKYPYIFLDEFQDTNPIQTQIIKWLGESGSLIGVIGDPAQSIYKFQGASRKDFLEFNILNQKNYKIEKNRRSTENIIKILNHLRNGDNINQSCYRANLGNDVLYIVSNDTNYIINKFKEVRKAIGCYKDYCIITRKNEDVIKLKNGDKSCDCKLWDKVFECDFSRGRFLKNLFTAQELAVEDRYEMAIKEVLKLFKSNRDGKLRQPFKSTIEITNLQKRSYAVSILEHLLNNREGNMNVKLLDFYNRLNNDVLESLNLQISKVGSRGKAKTCYESVILKDLISNLKLDEEKESKIRTIHKTKGTEFESVLVCIESNDDIENIISPNIENEEDDCRLYYVALSRAKDLLCIAVPEGSQEKKLKEIGLVSMIDNI